MNGESLIAKMDRKSVCVVKEKKNILFEIVEINLIKNEEKSLFLCKLSSFELSQSLFFSSLSCHHLHLKSHLLNSIEYRQQFLLSPIRYETAGRVNTSSSSVIPTTQTEVHCRADALDRRVNIPM